ERRRVVGELKSPHRPGLAPGAAKEVLAGQRAVKAGPGADEKDPRGIAQTLGRTFGCVIVEQPRQLARLAFDGFQQVTAGFFGLNHRAILPSARRSRALYRRRAAAAASAAARRPGRRESPRHNRAPRTPATQAR